MGENPNDGLTEREAMESLTDDAQAGGLTESEVEQAMDEQDPQSNN